MSNTLALVEAIEKVLYGRDGAAEHRRFVEALVDTANSLGLEPDVIEDALRDERTLVIYEP